MKQLILIVLVICSGGTLQAQCKATFEADVPQCMLTLNNTSNPSYLFQWKINDKTYSENSLSFPLDAYETFNICLYVTDTVNDCSDSVCRTIPGRKKIHYDYTIYKQNFVLTILSKGKPVTPVTYVADWGDDQLNTSQSGLFQHSYYHPGSYTILITMYDSIFPDEHDSIFKFPKICAFTIGDTIQIGSQNKCRAFFIWFEETRQDSVWLINRSVGERLKYHWDFGDGSTSTQRFPVHIYNAAAQRTVCLSIRDTQSNCTDTFCNTLQTFAGQRLQIIGDYVYDPPVSTGIDDINAADITIFPNPFSSTLSIRGLPLNGTVSWRISTATGQLLKKGLISDSGGTAILDPGDLSGGLYFLSISNEDRTYIRPIIKID